MAKPSSSDHQKNNGLKKGPWTPEEDQKLIDYIHKHGHGKWRTLPKNAGIKLLLSNPLNLLTKFYSKYYLQNKSFNYYHILMIILATSIY